ncbi:MAG TPA: copper homeostasis periplasmic binding protein CopC [Devosiaceae bacterium]|nr:copper homeostasis periplasmic binding protein CopC [Devosiaceae bacterium]
MNRFIPAVLFAAIASPAFAHAHLLNEVPAAKAVVTPAPTSLTLSFSEAVELHFTGVAVTGPDKTPVALGDAALDPKDAKILEVPLKGALPAGAYTVAWHALSTDGHKTNGTYTFTVK